LGRKLDWFRPAPERLQKVVAATSDKMNVPFREVLLMRSPIAQAYALPNSRQLLFTQRLLELLSDAEIAAVCAHELAHLTESKMARYSHSIQVLRFVPWIFFNPLLHNFGLIGFTGLLFITVVVPLIYRSISLKLELRADQMAKANEVDAGTYARALTRLYEDNFLPAVTAKNRATHPHLYDRIEAAGVVPDFPRPLAAGSIAWHGRIFAGLAGILFGVFAIRAIQLLSGIDQNSLWQDRSGHDFSRYATKKQTVPENQKLHLLPGSSVSSPRASRASLQARFALPSTFSRRISSPSIGKKPTPFRVIEHHAGHFERGLGGLSSATKFSGETSNARLRLTFQQKNLMDYRNTITQLNFHERFRHRAADVVGVNGLSAKNDSQTNDAGKSMGPRQSRRDDGNFKRSGNPNHFDATGPSAL
jgi:hypothetical protein